MFGVLGLAQCVCARSCTQRRSVTVGLGVPGVRVPTKNLACLSYSPSSHRITMLGHEGQQPERDRNGSPRNPPERPLSLVRGPRVAQEL